MYVFIKSSHVCNANNNNNVDDNKDDDDDFKINITTLFKQNVLGIIN